MSFSPAKSREWVLGYLCAVLVYGIRLMAEDKSETGAGKDDPKIEDEPAPVVSSHSVMVDGTVLKYHTTAGYLLIKEEEGKPLPGSPGAGTDKDSRKTKDGLKPKARVFYVAYTLDDPTNSAARPLAFVFNGGPGSSSVWLHLGGLAPRRVELTDEGESLPPPYRLVDNESTWLDQTDLVFIDPVSTGFSRPTTKEEAAQFHGLREDIAAVGEFIRLYTSRQGRWLSPKLLVGESYGTTRAAGLSDYLQSRYGFYLNGIVLVSSALNFGSIDFTPQNDLPFVGFLPGFATTAWYHKKLGPDLQTKTVHQVAAEARAFAGNEYTVALRRGDSLSLDEQTHVAESLSRLTGLPTRYWLQHHLKVTDTQFFGQLLRDEGRMVGRLDSRFSGLRYEPGSDMMEEYDPSDEAVVGPITATFNDYIRRELSFSSDLPYETLANVQPWHFGDASGGFPNTSDDLRKAMTRNPYLKVWVTVSYYDLATPFYAAELVVGGLNLNPSIRANLRMTAYESGHMLYIHAPSRKKFKADFSTFLQDSLKQKVVRSAARE